MFFLTQVTFQPFRPPPSPFSTLSCGSADLGIHGCPWVWAVREGVSPHFLRAVLVFCVPSPPTLNGTARDDPSHLWGLSCGTW